MNENTWERVPYAEHPDRCQGNRGDQGQCWNFKNPGSDYCMAHGGNRAPQEAAKRDLRLYQSNMFLAKVKEIGEEKELLSLNREVALMKSLVEAKLNLITDEHSFAMNHAGVAGLLMNLDKLVTSCARLNDKLGMSMNAQQALAFSDDVLSCIAEEIKDPDVIKRIQARIRESYERRSDRVQRSESDE